MGTNVNAETIALVQDEVAADDSLEAALRYQGYRVISANQGRGIMDLIASANGDISLVVVDLTIAGQNTLENLREIRRMKPRLPVIVVSEAASPARVVEAMRNGATDFLAKPVTDEQLMRAIKKATPDRSETYLDALLHPHPDRTEPVACGNPRMQAIRAAIGRIALSDVPVVLRGESGVGKEVLAREIHMQSPRAMKPFLKINCAALPLELLESELFGYERGAFTGAVKSTPGKFEIADDGILLLDEIGDMDVNLQAKLLHVLQDNEFQRLGGRETIRVNVRVLAATHCDLEKAILEKRFREDLYYRLNVISIHVPPLRERTDEVLPLARFFLDKHATPGLRVEITPALEQALLDYHWPGNIRELENVIRKLLVFADAEGLAQELRERTTVTALGPVPVSGFRTTGEARSRFPTLEEVQRSRDQAEAKAILEALDQTRWNRKRAAMLLNIDYKGLLYRMKKLGISPAEQPAAAARYRAAAGGSLGD